MASCNVGVTPKPPSVRPPSPSLAAFVSALTCRTDLCDLAGLPRAGVLCELVKPEDPTGSMARRDDCLAFARLHGLKMITIADLADFLSSSSPPVAAAAA